MLTRLHKLLHNNANKATQPSKAQWQNLLKAPGPTGRPMILCISFNRGKSNQSDRPVGALQRVQSHDRTGRANRSDRCIMQQRAFEAVWRVVVLLRNPTESSNKRPNRSDQPVGPVSEICRNFTLEIKPVWQTGRVFTESYAG